MHRINRLGFLGFLGFIGCVGFLPGAERFFVLFLFFGLFAFFMVPTRKVRSSNRPPKSPR